MAGCLGGADAREDAAGSDVDPAEVDLPLAEHDVPLVHEFETFADNAQSGGVSKDGIPSIDQPEFVGVAEGDRMLDPGAPVFGVELDGEVRAYPQQILVHHEIVNDWFDDRGVAVTYCPLTGTVIGFERGAVEFGVSGLLVNNNLIMFDRESDSLFPQILGTGVAGGLRGSSLREFRVTWTTWERWTDVHPDTAVLSDNTGHARDYSSGGDPYGQYNSREGYYADSQTLFDTLNEDDRHHPKDVFIGARTSDGVAVFRKDLLREEPVLETTVGGVPYLAAYDPALDTGYVYRNPDGDGFEASGEGYAGPDGKTHPAGDLPLPAVNAFDGMWFAWIGFYPDAEVVA